MRQLEIMLSAPPATALGWALVNFLWQGAAIAAALAVVLALLRRRAPEARYAACCIAMALMMAAPVATFLIIVAGRSGPAIATGGTGLAGLATPAFADRLSALVPALTALWLAGVAVFQARMLLHWWTARRLSRRGTRAAPDSWQRTVAELASRIGVRRAVAVLESSIAAVPMMIGWLRPVILVPASAVTGLSPGEMRAILAHELAHVRRHDYLVNLVQAVFESLLFYHPAVWWLSDRLRVEREYCCDDIAVAVGGSALHYARALAALDDLRGGDYRPALASTGGTLMSRIQRLLGVETNAPRRPGGVIAAMATTAAVVAVASTVALARPAEPPTARADVPFGPDAHALHEHFDLVAVLEAHDAAETEFIAALRDAGLDDESLMIVFETIGTDPDLVRAVHHHAQREHLIDSHLKAIHEEIAAAVAEGRMSEAEARERLDAARAKLHAGFERRRAQGGARDEPFGDAELGRARARIMDEVAAGHMTKEEAAMKLDDLRARIVEKVKLRRNRHREVFEIFEARMAEAQAEVEDLVAAGEITEEQAEERLQQVRREMHEKLQARFGPPPELKEKLAAIHEQVERELDAGLITEQEARKRLDAARRALHEHLLHEIMHDYNEFIEEQPAPAGAGAR